MLVTVLGGSEIESILFEQFLLENACSPGSTFAELRPWQLGKSLRTVRQFERIQFYKKRAVTGDRN